LSAQRDVCIWRIAQDLPYRRATDLSGNGAKFSGGRWNSKGQVAVYAASTIALATLETLAHLNDDIATRNTFVLKVHVPGSVWQLREVIEANELDPTWLAEPPSSTTIDFGDQWLLGGSAPLLLVPSVIVPEKYNLLINPAHAATGKITATVLRQYIYDTRF
jgi:RES domain-containing protein